MREGDVRNVVAGKAMAGTVVQARSIGRLYVQQGGPEAESQPVTDNAWVRAAVGSAVWEHARASSDVAFFRRQVGLIVEALAGLSHEAERTLGADPWRDPEVAVRFVERIEWLLGDVDDQAPLDLYPAEAALLVLIPFFYRTHALRMAAQYSVVDPARLTRAPDADADRRSYEAFTQGHDMLIKRALLRPEAAAPIGWWLFHRWMMSRGDHASQDGARELLELIHEPAQALGETLSAPRVIRFLHGVRRGPDVCNPEFLDLFLADERVRAPGHQRIREQRLLLLVTLAYGACLDLTALPSIVAEHLGIPYPVDLGLLRSTVELAVWGGTPKLPVLRAECHHEAVIEGLRDHTTRVDEILHAVNRTVLERIPHLMPALPTRLSADGVVPAEGAFDGWAGFRLDERRIRDLLMGVQLYKDRDLAVRELYQNALDACRYRCARTQYLDRLTTSASYSYEGRILLEQATDDGRSFLECRDNGIGMGDSELRGVFSHAGARFAEQADFKLERSAWAQVDPPVEFHPNSRFGIGVLSYFMLADEIRVTTCRMGPTGVPGPVLEASIFGPGHLFRIVKLTERGEEPGTRVRLYLRDEPRRAGAWSCVDVLERLLVPHQTRLAML